MPLVAPDARTDLRRFAVRLGAGLGLAPVLAVSSRAAWGDTIEAAEAVLTAASLALAALAAAASALVALAARALVACLLAAALGVTLMLGATLPIVLVLPRGMEAIGPEAMALLLPALAGFAAVPAGLALKALFALVRRA